VRQGKRFLRVVLPRILATPPDVLPLACCGHRGRRADEGERMGALTICNRCCAATYSKIERVSLIIAI
jgi:hypothetical protein